VIFLAGFASHFRRPLFKTTLHVTAGAVPAMGTTLDNSMVCHGEPNVKKTVVKRGAKTAMPHPPIRIEGSFVSLSPTK
jgi:hypothetical protein